MIALTKIRDLQLSAGGSAGRPLHLSAASGLVCLNSFLYIIADDELHLGVFRFDDNRPGNLVRLLEGELPDSVEDRKKQKPDLEALTFLPAFDGYPHGALFALGSGSKKKRRRGVLVAVNSEGAMHGAPKSVDLSELFEPIGEQFEKLNIEGAIVAGDEFCLLQRGNKKETQNAVIRFALARILDPLNSDQDFGDIAPDRIDAIELGGAGDVPFCFTDGCALPNGDIVFSAVAEDTEDAVEDGPCLGAAVGAVGKEGDLLWLRRLEEPHKIEGVNAKIEGGSLKLLLVTDADDAAVAATLYSAAIPIADIG